MTKRFVAILLLGITGTLVAFSSIVVLVLLDNIGLGLAGYAVGFVAVLVAYVRSMKLG